ncbi:circularly permuted type 2 ATP-grasp protein [Pseudomonas sp. LPB0260]|uniref:circularly permuted type 2 ATP-grasp protein n=1 Tax=Pseudomonas sp. LPB0260 TaxID=2614442 RepID=UPI0015C26834|nr:circularly permuted type 2 ATP-grasp protein [Pseudomonas sp. LPB0260]QLC73758.1 circularly permuted type 2 ATP-grasp protein [Pseudomonas sp. LPB0260]QLC76532.1 circularly permuted type 2 ATP-grasp protein [Pseudomonas sp. LPB0260]
MPDLLADYPLSDAAYHELVDAKGRVRPHWRRLFERLQGASPEQLAQRQALVARQIQENGVTYNVYADPEGADRPWELDLLPNLIPADEWRQIAAGVAQRAKLLDAVLADIYGPQQLIADGLLPAELVFGHNNFLWPCQGVRPAGDTFLHLYAVDLARAPDGRWWVTDDRTQAPSGAGYALENRQIVSRTLPELYRELNVQYLGGFFRTLQETLARQAPADGETPLVVLLTSGRFNESYFEHLYLARQLGYPLVEGSDLTVRDATLYLKTLAGLRRVHAVLRRMDDDFCDPLELRADSALGVPGLLEAVRRGRVLIANALGSGVLESPGLPGFLPAIAEKVLGEKLLLPSIASWWCGEAPVLQQALKKLPELLVRPSFPSQSFPPVLARDLDEAQRSALAERLRARPYAYVAQARPQLSQAPVWLGEADGLQSRAIGMRVFAVASAEGYRVMPGGLTRVAAAADAEAVSMQSGGASKDTWVLGERHPGGEPWQWWRALGVADLVRSDPFLPSRVVENLFWFGRYSSRCEDGARLLRIMLARYVDDDDDPQALESALALGESLGLLPEAASGELEQRLLQALLGADWPASLRTNLQRLQWTAGSVRGKLSQGNWQLLLELQREAHRLDAEAADFGELLDYLDGLLISLAALSGFALDDMTRDDGWRFLLVGRSIERLHFMAESVAAFLRSDAVGDSSALAWLLELGNSSITYRTRYLASAQLIPVLDLLLLDEQNPHAVLFQLRTLLRALGRLGERYELPDEVPLRQLEQQLSDFSLASLENPLFGPSSVKAVLLGLADLLERIAGAGEDASEHLGLRFFVHVDPSQRTQST